MTPQLTAGDRTRKQGAAKAAGGLLGGQGGHLARWLPGRPCSGVKRGPTRGATLHTRGEWSGLNLYRYIIQRMQTVMETQIQTSS